MLKHYRKIAISVYLGFIMMGFSSVFGQTPEPNKELAATNYSVALQSENPGVVESALFHSVLFKKAFNQQDSVQILNGIAHVYNNGMSKRLRHKAYLIHSLLNIPGLLESVDTEVLENEEVFYRTVSELVTRELLSANTTENF